MRLADLYFNHCYQRFLEKEREAVGVRRFIRIADKFTVCLRFSDESLVEKFFRPFEHLSTPTYQTNSELTESSDPTEPVDLTICVWDSLSAPGTVPPMPSWDERMQGPQFGGSGNFRFFSDVNPNTLSLLDTNRSIGLFWINDSNHFPWVHSAHPFSAITAWWALTNGLLFLHAGCVATEDDGVLIIGGPGTGKSTFCLSAVSENLRYVSDDFCLVGTESGATFVYNLYNTAMLEPIESIPKLDSYKLNRSVHPKAIVSLHESCPEKIVGKVPISTILLLSETGENLIEPISVKQAISALVASSSLVMGMVGYSSAEFFALHRMFQKIPCFKVNRSADLCAVSREVTALLSQVKREPGRRIEQCTRS